MPIETLSFAEVTRLANPNDNVVIVTRDIEAGTLLDRGNLPQVSVQQFVLEGHRIAFDHIPPDSPLLSWGLPFGKSITPIEPGASLFNQAMIDDLSKRSLEFELPASPNFSDWSPPFSLDSGSVHTGNQVSPYSQQGSFLGFPRPGTRGSGTRNFVVVLGTSSRATSFIKLLESGLPDVLSKTDSNFEGVVCVHHTEGGTLAKANNHELVLRTLAGWIIHSNVSGVLLLDHGEESVTAREVLDFMEREDYPLADCRIRNLELGNDPIFQNLQNCRKILNELVSAAREETRTQCPLSHLKIALQCGGSDAFSGMSGNPLAGWMARELLKHGGSANLAETSELIGAESYVLANVRNMDVAQKFVDAVAEFELMAKWHGHSAEGNPSGGNLYRGLYNITIKSIGAANKKHSEVRLDEVIAYGQPMTSPGYYFMDSAGNDLESIAGQVASGCNLVLFITGNGSITNFPFVPTLKIVTTTARYQLLRKDMDINAGAYLDGTPMEQLGADSFASMIRCADGQKSVGELAGHSQAQIWRNWHMRSVTDLTAISSKPRPHGIPLKFHIDKIPQEEVPDIAGILKPVEAKLAIIPTSLCSSQVAAMLSREINNQHGGTVSSAMAHTEGCGVSRGPSENLYVRTMVGYATHPAATNALFLEHGCEKTHHAEFSQFLVSEGYQPDTFHWESIQGSGGLDNTRDHIFQWAEKSLGSPSGRNTHSDPTTLAILTRKELDQPQWFPRLVQLIQYILGNHLGSVIIGENDPVLALLERNMLVDSGYSASIEYGEKPRTAGLHIMEPQTDDEYEIITGLGACGTTHFFTNIDTSAGTAPPFSHRVVWNQASGKLEIADPVPDSIRPFQVTRGDRGFSL